jgi:predicted ferric reductase
MQDPWRLLLARMAGIMVGLVVGTFVMLWLSPIMAQALGTMHSGWYLSRSTGILAYILGWISTVAGLLITGRQAQQWPGVVQANDIHRQASLASLVMICIHAVVLLMDTYIGYTWQTLFIPSMTGPYAPIAVGLGQIALPIAVIVTLSAEWRSKIGKAWRWIHVGAFFVYFAGALHSIFSGSDTRIPWIAAMYVVTISSVLFLTVYRIVYRRAVQLPAEA